MSGNVMPIRLLIWVLHLHFISRQVGTAVALLLVVWAFERTFHALPTARRVGFTRCGARTRDHRREAIPLLLLVLSPMLLSLWFGHTHAHKTCASDLGVEGICTTSTDTAGCASPDIYTITVTERRLLRNTTSYVLSGDSPPHMQGFWPPSTAAVVCVPVLRMRSLCLERATSRHVCFMSPQAARS